MEEIERRNCFSRFNANLQRNEYCHCKTDKRRNAEIEHHMLDFLDVTTRYSVAEYVRAAHKCIEQIAGKGKLPIVCGGTGLYIDSCLKILTLVR